MSGIFDKPSPESMDEQALIIWVLEDCSKIPEISYIYEFNRKLEIALGNDGFDGNVIDSIAIVDPKADSTEFRQSFDVLQEKFQKYSLCIEIVKCQGDKDARFNCMLLSILLWSFVKSAVHKKIGNVVLISSNENFGQGTKFSQVRDTLLKKGFNVALVNPDTLLKDEVLQTSYDQIYGSSVAVLLERLVL